MKQRISGDELKRIIPDLKGIDYIERVSATKFNIEPTFIGSAMISDGAYIEIIPNSSIQGLGSSNNTFSTKGISLKVVGVNKTASISVGSYKVQSFVVSGNNGFFKVGNKIKSFGL